MRVLVTLRPGVVTVPNTVAPGSVVTVPFLVTTLPFSTFLWVTTLETVVLLPWMVDLIVIVCGPASSSGL